MISKAGTVNEQTIGAAEGTGEAAKEAVRDGELLAKLERLWKDTMNRIKFIEGRSYQVQRAYENFAGDLIKSDPLNRATKLGLALIVISTLLSLGNSILIWFRFPEDFALSMLLLGGVLVLVAVVGQMSMKRAVLKELAKQADNVTTEAFVKALPFIKDLLPSGEDHHNDRR